MNVSLAPQGVSHRTPIGGLVAVLVEDWFAGLVPSVMDL
jgi:hypothetical protein